MTTDQTTRAAELAARFAVLTRSQERSMEETAAFGDERRDVVVELTSFMSYSQIAELLGMSRQRVGQIVRAAS